MIDFSQLVVAIDTQRQGAAVLIRPHIENPTPLTLRYRMAVSQSSSSGTSSINQEGQIQTGVTPSFVRLSVPPQATCLIHLELFQDDLLIKAMDQRCDGTAN